ncbi:hypothetical protein MUN77_07380 [Leucobacter allii]|uniref:hypothetical protein n=1 Tax=Leucobacter allii TaxID=2932247 RepID=UPI001FD2FAF9|nr:hypothetical protein [Leucobacter allii]UOR03108.1 hypothetical protein MUN77_07380 [Leucobacter allii]
MTAIREARWLAGACAALLLLPLAACAPEPDAGAPRTSDPSDAASAGGAAGAADGDAEKGGTGGSWQEQTDEEQLERNVELPESFPSEAFAVPEGATVWETGARGADEWFLVLRAADAATAEAWWQSVIDASGFVVGASGTTPEGGRTASLASDGLTAEALLLPEADGSVLLSYDIARG